MNPLINDVRQAVDLWRALGYPGVTTISRKLLQHWADPTRENRVLFCQREAAETAIFLAEAAGRNGNPDFRPRLGEANLLHNDGLPRVGLKMATGSGKTVVMAMLIAWQTINKVYAGQGPDEADVAAPAIGDTVSFEQTILDNLAKAGIQNGRKNERFTFESVEP